MREYLFRGKRKDNDEWIEGYYACESNHACFQWELKHRHYIFRDEFMDWSLGGLCQYEVIPKSVGQWTGLCDKNGRKIFEGDIISIMFETDGVDGFPGYSWYETAAVVFSEEKHAWIVVFDDGGEEMYLSEYDDVDDICVIATVFDKADLLEG